MPVRRARRLGFDALRAVRNGTGLGNYARALLTGLREADQAAEFHLYAPELPAPQWSAFPSAIGATMHVPHGPWGAPVLNRVHRTLRLGHAAARDGIQLYHGLSHEIPRDLASAGVRSVVTFHDLLFLRAPELFPVIDRASYRWRYEWSARHATHVIAVSEHTAADLVDAYAIPRERITVIPPAVDPAFGSPMPSAVRRQMLHQHAIPDEFVVSVGTLEARKNHQVLLDAYAMLDPGAPPLVLVGRDGGAAGHLRAHALRLGLGDRVRFIGGVPPTDLPAIVQSARALLYPSRAEGFGMPIAEGLSAAVPVIALDTPTSREAGGSAARLVADDPAAFAAAIGDALAGRHASTAEAHAEAARFDRRALAERTWAVYDHVLAS